MALPEDVAQSLALEWRGLRHSLGRVRGHYTASFAGGGVFLPQISNEIYALFLPFGYSVLEHVLQQFREQNNFESKSTMLNSLMVASKDKIPWQNYDAIETGRLLRNALVHNREVPPVARTMETLDSIEHELIGWGILQGPVEYNFTISRTPTN